MNIDDVVELYYICPLSNINSIMKRGILSNKKADYIEHDSVASKIIQQKREKKLPNGRYLHEYVNLYFCARNPMLYLRKGQHQNLGILRISRKVLELEGVIISDRNASSDWARFSKSPDGLAYIDKNLLFATYWTHPEDQIAEWKHKSIKCAEVLVPNQLATRFIIGVYVSCRKSMNKLLDYELRLKVEINQDIFFLR